MVTHWCLEVQEWGEKGEMCLLYEQKWRIKMGQECVFDERYEQLPKLTNSQIQKEPELGSPFPLGGTEPGSTD